MRDEQGRRDAERARFETWIRRGSGDQALARSASPLETKYNPWHDPDDGRFTFAGTGRYFPRGGGGATAVARQALRLPSPIGTWRQGGLRGATPARDRAPAPPPAKPTVRQPPRARQAAPPAAPRPRPIGPNGYVPAKGDANTLARMIFAESVGIPGDFEAIGWSIVNRVGNRQHGRTLEEVLRKKGAFQIVEEGGGPKAGSGNWGLSARPDKMTASELVAWRREVAVANGILNGRIPDPTGGATLFFASSSFTGRSDTAPGDFERMIRDAKIVPSKYRTTSRRRRRQYFFLDVSQRGKSR